MKIVVKSCEECDTHVMKGHLHMLLTLPTRVKSRTLLMLEILDLEKPILTFKALISFENPPFYYNTQYGIW